MPRGVYERKPKDQSMPKKTCTMVTWLGEDDLHDEDAPQTNEWRGIVFTKGVPVKVDDPHLIAKANANPFYRVEEADEEAFVEA